MVLGTPAPRPRPQPRPAPPSSSRPPLGSPLLSLRPWPASIVDSLASLSSTIRVAAHRRLGRCRAARRPIGRGASGRGRGGCSMQACSSLHVTTLRLRRWAVRWQASEAKPSELERGADLSGAVAAGRLGEGRELGIWEARQLVPLGPPHWSYWALSPCFHLAALLTERRRRRMPPAATTPCSMLATWGASSMGILHCKIYSMVYM